MSLFSNPRSKTALTTFCLSLPAFVCCTETVKEKEGRSMIHNTPSLYTVHPPPPPHTRARKYGYFSQKTTCATSQWLQKKPTTCLLLLLRGTTFRNRMTSRFKYYGFLYRSTVFLYAWRHIKLLSQQLKKGSLKTDIDTPWKGANLKCALREIQVICMRFMVCPCTCRRDCV